MYKKMLIFKIFLEISLLIHQVPYFASSYCTKSLVPALYVFGDSLLDVGNNNLLGTPAKANTFPYGIDFNNCSTGRFSNGKNFADILAIRLGLPMPPPNYGLSSSERSQITYGTNFASASSGILNSTGIGGYFPLEEQIGLFIATVNYSLPRIIQDIAKLKEYLSKSIFLFSVGSNDYIQNYLHSSMGSYYNDNPEEYADYLLEEMASRIKRMYDIGARKFLFIGIGQIGCSPSYIIRKQNSKECNEDVNQKIKPFSDKLPQKLQSLKTQLSELSFVVVQSFNYYDKIRKSPETYGYNNIYDSCIGEGGKPCEDRNMYFYYDNYGHPTEKTSFHHVNECFSGSQLCVPINVEQLIAA